MTTDKIKAIAELNDLFRNEPENYGHLGRHVHTAGIAALPILLQFEIMHRVGLFEKFTPDNDPYGEHDFGAIKVQGKRIFWKIDYYNKDMTGGSEDPSDITITTRVLTTMLATEY